jgi:hypothetical protein
MRGEQHGHGAGPWRGQADVRMKRASGDVDGSAVEQRPQDRQVLAHVVGGPVEAVPVHVLDDDLVRQPDAEGQPAGPDRERRGQRLLRQHRRMPRVGGHDGGAELDAWHLAARHRQRGQCLESEDVRDPHRREPVIDGPADLVGQVAQGLGVARLHRRDADPHVRSPSARRRLVRRPGI